MRIKTGPKNYVTLKRVWCIWAAITKEPQVTVRKLAEQTGIPFCTVSAALRVLRDAGYIDFADRTNGARTILIGYAETNKAAGEGG